jgi:hypothetical protein
METLELLGTFSAGELRAGVKIPLNGRKVRGFAVEKQ